MKNLLISLSLLLFSLSGYAGNTNPGGLEPAPEPPDLPEAVQSGESIEPQVTIIRKDDAVIEEYRVNGHLYMVKITPTVGPAYYLVDDNGNGELDTRRSSLDDTNIPRWVLLRW
ncbi:MAG: DUF2782 domain-containing protein [Gammaproteobacteria bacterium]